MVAARENPTREIFLIAPSAEAHCGTPETIGRMYKLTGNHL